MRRYLLRFQCTGCKRYDLLDAKELYRCQIALKKRGFKFYKCPYGCPFDEDMVIREVIKNE